MTSTLGPSNTTHRRGGARAARAVTLLGEANLHLADLHGLVLQLLLERVEPAAGGGRRRRLLRAPLLQLGLQLQNALVQPPVRRPGEPLQHVQWRRGERRRCRRRQERHPVT